MIKPIIIIQARMNSERLPGKVLKPVGETPLIGVLLERIANAGIQTVLATSDNPENDLLAQYAEDKNIEVYRGSEDNVLERYFEVAKAHQSDLIFRLTGDNPFIDSNLLMEVLAYYKKEGGLRSYLSTGLSKSFPLGISIEVFSSSLLEEAYEKANSTHEHEHVTVYMHQNIPGDINIIAYPFYKDRYKYRLTVDTEEDFELIQILIEQYNAKNKTIEEIIDILDKQPSLLSINNNIVQRNWK